MSELMLIFTSPQVFEKLAFVYGLSAGVARITGSWWKVWNAGGLGNIHSNVKDVGALSLSEAHGFDGHVEDWVKVK